MLLHHFPPFLLPAPASQTNSCEQTAALNFPATKLPLRCHSSSKLDLHHLSLRSNQITSTCLPAPIYASRHLALRFITTFSFRTPFLPPPAMLYLPILRRRTTASALRATCLTFVHLSCSIPSATTSSASWVQPSCPKITTCSLLSSSPQCPSLPSADFFEPARAKIGLPLLVDQVAQAEPHGVIHQSQFICAASSPPPVALLCSTSCKVRFVVIAKLMFTRYFPVARTWCMKTRDFEEATTVFLTKSPLLLVGTLSAQTSTGFLCSAESLGFLKSIFGKTKLLKP